MNEQMILMTLKEIRQILERHRVQFWSDFVAEQERRLSDAYSKGQRWAIREALREIEVSYGGMGSFNDFIICKESGHDIETEEGWAINEELNNLRSQLYQMIQKERMYLE